MSKLLASQFIEIDDAFLEKVSSRLFEKKQISEYYTVEQVAEKLGKTAQTIRAHIRNHKNQVFNKPNLRGIKPGKDWLVSEEDLNDYLKCKKRQKQ